MGRSIRRPLLFALAVVMIASCDGGPPSKLGGGPYDAPIAGAGGEWLVLSGAEFESIDAVAYEPLGTAMKRNKFLSVPPSKLPTGTTSSKGRIVGRRLQKQGRSDHLFVHLPAAMEASREYALWIRRSGEPLASPGIAINDARPVWLSPAQIVAGEPQNIRVLGRNLTRLGSGPMRVRFIPRSGAVRVFPASELANDPRSTGYQVQAEVLLAAGSYEVKLDRGTGRFTELNPLSGDGREPQRLVVEPVESSNTVVLNGASCSPSEGNDDTSCLWNAIDGLGDGATLVIPEGTWNVTICSSANLDCLHKEEALLRLRKGQSVRGEGPSTIIEYEYSIPDLPGESKPLLALTGNNVVEGLVLRELNPLNNRSARMAIRLDETKGVGASDVVIREVGFEGTTVGVGMKTGKMPSDPPARRVTIANNTFQAWRIGVALNGPMDRVEDLVLRDNQFLPSWYLLYRAKYTNGPMDDGASDGARAVAIAGGRRMLIEDNRIAPSRGGGTTSGNPAGFRAGFFLNSTGSHEMELVTDNVAECIGPNIGDGELIAFDANGTPAQHPVTVKEGFIDKVRVAAAFPQDLMLRDPWLFVVSGRGAGQSRRVFGISSGEVEVWPPMRVAPDAGSRVLVTTAHWETHIVGNEIDNRHCPTKPAREAPDSCKGGGIFTGATVSNVDIVGNTLRNTSGIQVFAQSSSAGSTQVASRVRVRTNSILGQFGRSDPGDDPGHPDCAPGSIPPLHERNGGLQFPYNITYVKPPLPRILNALEVADNEVCTAATSVDLRPTSLAADVKFLDGHLGAAGIVFQHNRWSGGAGAPGSSDGLWVTNDSTATYVQEGNQPSGC